MNKAIEIFRKSYINGNKYFNIISTGIEINPLTNMPGILVTITTDNLALRKQAVSELTKTLPVTFLNKNVRIDESDALVFY